MMAAFNDWSGVWAAAFPALLCLYVMIGASVHVLRREARPESPVLRGELPSVAVLVPARNEAKVLEECLLALLDSGPRAGATLDVFRTEPLPADHPFWAHPRIHITPHTSARTLRDHSIAQIAGKIGQLADGVALASIAGVVDLPMGY